MLEIGPLLALYTCPGQPVQIFFRARLLNPETIGPGPESLNVALFTWDRVPWTALAFTTVSWALNAWRESRALDAFPPYRNP